MKTALNHQEPDRIPIDFGGTFLSSAPEGMQKQLVEILGLTEERDPRFDKFDNRIQEHFGCDLRSLMPAKTPNWHVNWEDQLNPTLGNAAIEDLKTFDWPLPDDKMIEGVEKQAQFLHKETDYYICSSQIGQGIFELGCWLRGYENILIDLALNRDWIKFFNEKALETIVKLNDLYYSIAGPYVDMVLLGDDYATQESLYMAPEVFRELYKPYFKEYIASIKKYCPDAKIGHHCCGSSWLLLDDFAEIGIEVINPVQTNARNMEPENLAIKKDKLSFHGGVDLQHILPYGTEKEVIDFVTNLIQKLGINGGYILAACHTLPEDVKPENIITMLETALKVGKY